MLFTKRSVAHTYTTIYIFSCHKSENKSSREAGNRAARLPNAYATPQKDPTSLNRAPCFCFCCCFCSMFTKINKHQQSEAKRKARRTAQNDGGSGSDVNSCPNEAQHVERVHGAYACCKATAKPPGLATCNVVHRATCNEDNVIPNLG